MAAAVERPKRRQVCFIPGVDRLAEEASLWVAASSLLEVQSVIGAIRRADAAGRQQRLGEVPAAAIEPRPHLHPAAVYEPRPHRHPSPVYEARPHARERSHWRRCCPTVCAADVQPLPPQTPTHRIEPPWAVLGWPQPLPPAHAVKIPRPRTDVTGKGAILDIFL